MELRDRDDRDGDAGPELHPAGRAGQRGQQQRAVRQRVPGVEVAEQHGDRRTAARAARRRSRGPPSGAAGGRTRRPGEPRPTRTRASRRRPTARARRRSAATRPASSPGRPAAGRSRTARPRRATSRRAWPGRTGSRPRGRAARPRAAGRGRSPPLAGCSATASSRSRRRPSQTTRPAMTHGPRLSARSRRPVVRVPSAMAPSLAIGRHPGPIARRPCGRVVLVSGRRTRPAGSAAGRRAGGDRRTPTARRRTATRIASARSAGTRTTRTTTVATHRTGWMANGEMLRNANAPLSHSRRMYARVAAGSSTSWNSPSARSHAPRRQQRADLPAADPVDGDQHRHQLEAAGDRDAWRACRASASA